MNNQKRIFLFLLILLALGAIYYFELPQFFSLKALKEHVDILLYTVQNYYWFSVLTYILFYSFAIALSLPGAAALSLLGGFLFETLPGMLFILIGATSGAVLSFLVVRYIAGMPLQKKYQKKLHIFNKELNEFGAFYLLFLRLIPIFPFFLINILAGLTPISLKTFFITTLVGIMPGAFVFSFAGQQLHNIKQLADVFSLKVILAFTLLGLFALLPVLYKKLIYYFKSNNNLTENNAR